MKMKFAVALATIFLACPAYGQVVLFNSFGFEPGAGYVLGDLNGQNTWTVDTPPGAYSVQGGTVLDGTQAAQALGGATNWAFPPINYTPAPGELIRIEASIARTVTGAPVSFGYSIDVYNSLVARTTRFGLVNNAGVIQPYVTSRLLAGVFDPTGALANVLVGGPVAPGTFVNFEARLNYVAKNLRLYVNGVDVGANIPFADQTLTAADIADADFQVSSAAGATDVGFLDNYAVSTVPEPTSMALMGLAGLAFGVRRKLRRKA